MEVLGRFDDGGVVLIARFLTEVWACEALEVSEIDDGGIVVTDEVLLSTAVFSRTLAICGVRVPDTPEAGCATPDSPKSRTFPG